MGAICCSESTDRYEGEVDLSYFNLLRSVGKGAFGKVRVVQHKGTKQLFALKYINKGQCIKMRAVHNIMSERRLLEQVTCPGVVNLRYAFQDDEYLFMVIDLMLGGDLRFHLDKVGMMKEDWVRFYAAELSLALNYLHSKHIVHRDLKPDNVLLNEHGHAHLTDFNIAVQLKDGKPISSIAGSMAYMAPEVLSKSGYDTSVDWWSLGVICFELLFGKRPFNAKSQDELADMILHAPVKIPKESNVSSEAIDFICALMDRDLTKRLGYSEQGFQRLLQHPWFQEINWDALKNQDITPPFVPDSKGANFDPTHELEEILLEDNPLKVRKRKRQTDTAIGSPSPTPAVKDKAYWLRLMEDEFLTYDFLKPEENQRRRDERSHRKAMAMSMGKIGQTTSIDTQPTVTTTTGTSYTEEALQERNDYIKQAGGVPPPPRPTTKHYHTSQGTLETETESHGVAPPPMTEMEPIPRGPSIDEHH